MHFNAAIKLLAPFHKARLVAHYATESGIQGQLSTGLCDSPFIPVNDSQVCADDVFSVLEAYDEAQWAASELESTISFNCALPLTPENSQWEWGLTPV